MNLRQRFSLTFSLLFSLILATAMLIVYSLYARFRTEEFRARLEQKAYTTIRLLSQVKQVDYRLLKTIDRNTINELYNEKILIFNDSLQLVYSSIDDAPVSWTKKELEDLRKQKSFLRRSGEYEVYGMFYDTRFKDYFALVSAEDLYGKNKLRYLSVLLLSAFIGGSLLVGFLSYYVSGRALAPLDKFRAKITSITEKNLNEKLPETGRYDEIGALSNTFNQMLDRINTSYTRQKDFTSNASHELRTPITRIVAQLENLLLDPATPPETKTIIREVSTDTYQLSDIVSSLLLLSKIDTEARAKEFQDVRLDEIIFYAGEQLRKAYPDFHFHFELEATQEDLSLEVKGDETLLQIAIGNLFKNAYLYSADRHVQCVVHSFPDRLQVEIINKGATPGVADTASLFNSFTRGTNARNTPGSGLGLSLVKRILDYHGATINYQTPDEQTNLITIDFLS